MTSATKLTSKGQVVIPKEVRERLRWRPGTRLAVEEGADGAITLRALRPASGADAIDQAFGFLAGSDPLSELEAEHLAEVAADERRRR